MLKSGPRRPAAPAFEASGHTRPWFTLGGTLVGLAAAVATLVRILPMGGGRA